MKGYFDISGDGGSDVIGQVTEKHARIARALGAAVSRVVLSTRKNTGAVVRLDAHPTGDVVALRIHGPAAAPLGRGAAFALTVAARLVEAHGGTAWTEADLEKTGELRLTLPRSR